MKDSILYWLRLIYLSLGIVIFVLILASALYRLTQ